MGVLDGALRLQGQEARQAAVRRLQHAEAAQALLRRGAARESAARAGALSRRRADRRHAVGAASRAQAGVRVRRQDARVRDDAIGSTGGSRRSACRKRRWPNSGPGSRAFTRVCRPCAASRPRRMPARRRCATSTSSPATSGRAGSACSSWCALGPNGSARAWRRVFARRAAAGAHRECHGDLHLQNLLWRDGKIVAFDALEFDRKLREIDVVSETAFLAMDLLAHGRTDLAYELLNALSRSQRRLWRRRRAALLPRLPRARPRQGRRDQASAVRSGAGTTPSATSPRRSSSARRRNQLLVITHGLSGSGKTSVTDELVGRLPAMRAALGSRAQAAARAHRCGAHRVRRSGPACTPPPRARRTYAALADIADLLLRNGQSALIDATFLRRSERLEFRKWRQPTRRAS